MDEYVSRTRRRTTLPGIEKKPGGRIGEKNRIPPRREAEPRIEVLTASSTQTRWERLPSFALCDKRGIYLFRLIPVRGGLIPFRRANQD